MDNAEWEEIESNTTTTSQFKYQDSDEFVVLNDDEILSEPSNFLHPLTTQRYQEEDNKDGSFQEPPSPQPPHWRACLKTLGFGIVEVAYKIRFYAVSAAGLWPIAAAGILFLVVWYGKGRPWRRRRRRPENIEVNWMLFSREKDQKIRQLLLQIAQMNEILSASQRVPVHRVG